jgi:hypothetical protein
MAAAPGLWKGIRLLLRPVDRHRLTTVEDRIAELVVKGRLTASERREIEMLACHATDVIG